MKITGMPGKVNRMLLMTVMVIILICVFVTVFLNGKILSGGKYVNNQYGFTIEFPPEWAGDFIIEEKFDSIVVYDRKVAILCDKEKGILFTLYVKRKGKDMSGDFLGKTGNYVVSYVIAEEKTLNIENDVLQKEYEGMLDDTERVLKELIFSETDTKYCRDIQESITISKAEKLLTFLDTDVDGQLGDFLKELPFGQLLENCSLDGTTITLEYQTKAIEAYNGMDIGDISRIISEACFSIFDSIDQVVINYNSECCLGYSREGMKVAAEQVVNDGNAELFYELLLQKPDKGREREYGNIGKEALTIRPVKIYQKPDCTSEVKYSVIKNAPVYIEHAAGEFYYVEWRYTEGYDYCGYIKRDSVDLEGDFQKEAAYGYCYDAELYLKPDGAIKDMYRGWFLINEESDNWFKVTLPQDEIYWLRKEQIQRGLIPEIVKLSIEELLELFPKGIVQAYSLGQTLALKGEIFILEDSILEKIPEKYRNEFIKAIEDMSGLVFSDKKEKDVLVFSLIEKKSEYSTESALVTIKMAKDSQYSVAEILMIKEIDSWNISKAVITEAQ